MRWMTIPVVAGQGALRGPLTPRNLNPRDRQRKRRRKKRRKRRRQEKETERVEAERVEAETGRRSRAARTAVWRRERWRFETWAWALTRMRLSSSSFVWAPASLQEQITTWRWRRCWRTARCPGAPPARSATTPAADPTGTSRFPSWMPRPHGGPSSRYQPPAACVWAEGMNEGEGDEEGVSPVLNRAESASLCWRPGCRHRPEGSAVTHRAEVMQATCWLPVVYFLLMRKRSGRSWTMEVKGLNQRLRGKSSGINGLDFLLHLQRVNCFSTE